jgi:hypothetical protein
MLPLPAITLVSAKGPGRPISLPVMIRLRSSFVGVTPISPIWSGPGVFEAAERCFRDDDSQTPGYELMQGCRDIVGRLAAPEHLPNASHMFTASNSMLVSGATATRQKDLAQPDRPKNIRGLTAEQMARMEREMDGL